MGLLCHVFAALSHLPNCLPHVTPCQKTELDRRHADIHKIEAVPQSQQAPIWNVPKVSVASRSQLAQKWQQACKTIKAGMTGAGLLPPSLLHMLEKPGSLHRSRRRPAWAWPWNHGTWLRILVPGHIHTRGHIYAYV